MNVTATMESVTIETNIDVNRGLHLKFHVSIHHTTNR